MVRRGNVTVEGEVEERLGEPRPTLARPCLLRAVPPIPKLRRAYPVDEVDTETEGRNGNGRSSRAKATWQLRTGQRSTSRV
jgi:hypothetical protein